MEKAAKELTHIEISKIKGNLTEGGSDIYFKILVGSNMVKTTPKSNASKDFLIE
jgi:hypothetical protein